ncbi:hypothetical protein B0T25DRAFT_13653 [Lasiosphaeria hispida]|uniref:Uncharacterized protein n=1 Tax=Lasiosphaeria hispida TaxID=260671 RepID=A0AAJ0MJF8_9PEZI|nr:hypothetical protein B0T25DRAFT_13653 [Lasiosphaeria hispida]
MSWEHPIGRVLGLHRWCSGCRCVLKWGYRTEAAEPHTSGSWPSPRICRFLSPLSRLHEASTVRLLRVLAAAGALVVCAGTTTVKPLMQAGPVPRPPLYTASLSASSSGAVGIAPAKVVGTSRRLLSSSWNQTPPPFPVRMDRRNTTDTNS